MRGNIEQIRSYPSDGVLALSVSGNKGNVKTDVLNGFVKQLVVVPPKKSNSATISGAGTTIDVTVSA